MSYLHKLPWFIRPCIIDPKCATDSLRPEHPPKKGSVNHFQQEYGNPEGKDHFWSALMARLSYKTEQGYRTIIAQALSVNTSIVSSKPSFALNLQP